MKSDFKLQKNNCGLMIIDMQKHFCYPQGIMYIKGVEPVIDKIQVLLNTFRQTNRPVIFTRHIDAQDKDNLMLRWWEGQLKIDDPMSEIIDQLKTNDCPIIHKPQYDAFLQTELNDILKNYSLKQLVICGVLTNICCETTARGAFMRGYEVYFVKDATATYSKEMHNASLVNLAYGFAVLMSAQQVIEVFK